MPAASDRRFTIFDAMILVAAVAIGLAWSRAIGLQLWTPQPLLSSLVWWVEAWTEGTVAFLTLTWLGLRMRRPRPPFRRLIRQPGSAMCFAASSAMLAGLFEGLVDIVFRQPSPMRYRIVGNYVGAIRDSFPDRFFPGTAALGVLVILFASGRARRGRGWIERLGQTLGAYWIFWLFVNWFGYLF